MTGRDHVYVSEIGREVNIFTIDGKLLTRWGMSRLVTSGGQDKKTALFLSPYALVVDSRGDLYVGEISTSEFGVDRGARTVQKFARRT